VRVIYCIGARDELAALPPGEQAAIRSAVEKLELFGDRLAAPHSSAVRGASATLRELRPRSGRSAWRAFYRRIGAVMVIGAIGPEALANPRGFRRAVAEAIERLSAMESELRDV
jgi:hypothetical protein